MRTRHRYNYSLTVSVNKHLVAVEQEYGTLQEAQVSAALMLRAAWAAAGHRPDVWERFDAGVHKPGFTQFDLLKDGDAGIKVTIAEQEVKSITPLQQFFDRVRGLFSLVFRNTGIGK